MLQVVKYILGYSLCLYEIATFSILVGGKKNNEELSLFKTSILFGGEAIGGISLLLMMERIFEKEEMIGFIIGVLGGFSNIIILLLSFRRKKQEQEEKQILRAQNKSLVDLISSNKVLDERRRKMGHDFNNHISCIDMLLQMGNIERAREYIAKMNQNYSKYYAGISVNHEIADAIMNEKYLKAQKSHIDFLVEGQFEALNIDEMDFCIILGNSLDNAIEAAMRIEDEAERYIEVKIENTKSVTCITVLNSMKEIAQEGKRLLTTKKDKEHHGIGINSMQAAAMRNNGEIKWQCSDGEFKLKVILNK
ncbi:sensor histidine kinase [Cellulosilyticum ruminicola]|uniref:sensor histidine kinase n=1 Tax=Cellulosilyticum ruminicola TaxID=425254 RepID=UPI0006CF9DF4|nr:GHKL domain-containing protein [Cellulosilyticum ruminicola]